MKKPIKYQLSSENHLKFVWGQSIIDQSGAQGRIIEFQDRGWLRVIKADGAIETWHCMEVKPDPDIKKIVLGQLVWGNKFYFGLTKWEGPYPYQGCLIRTKRHIVGNGSSYLEVKPFNPNLELYTLFEVIEKIVKKLSGSGFIPVMDFTQNRIWFKVKKGLSPSEQDYLRKKYPGVIEGFGSETQGSDNIQLIYIH